MTRGKDFDGTLRAKVKYFAHEPRVQDVVTCREDTGQKAAGGSEGRWLLALKVPRPQARRVPEDRRPAPPTPRGGREGCPVGEQVRPAPPGGSRSERAEPDGEWEERYSQVMQEKFQQPADIMRPSTAAS